MKLCRYVLLSFVTGCFFFCSCSETKEGWDKVSGQATGLNQLKKQKEVESDIKDISNQMNQRNQDALDALDDIKNK